MTEQLLKDFDNIIRNIKFIFQWKKLRFKKFLF